MKTTKKEYKEIANHMDRRIQKENIKNEFLLLEACKDMVNQFKREFGLTEPNELDDKYLYEAHEFIDNYKLPFWLWEKVELEKENGEINN